MKRVLFGAPPGFDEPPGRTRLCHAPPKRLGDTLARLPLPLALIALFACGCGDRRPFVDAGQDAGTPSACTQNSDCSLHEYCDFQVIPCPGFSPNALVAPVGMLSVTGTCHRNCDDGYCACDTSEDCAGRACNDSSHACVPLNCPASFCPDQCPAAAVESQTCGACVCAACPDIDAGQCLTWDAGDCNGSLSPQTCTCADSTSAQYGCNGPPSCEDACCGHGGAADGGN